MQKLKFMVNPKLYLKNFKNMKIVDLSKFWQILKTTAIKTDINVYIKKQSKGKNVTVFQDSVACQRSFKCKIEFKRR